MSIIEDTKYLKSVDDIEEYFKDCGHEYFDCGQGYFQDEASEFVKIGSDYFLVTMKADIEGTKQDRGDRLYFVENIRSVTYEPTTLEHISIVLNEHIIRKIMSYQNKIEKLKEQLI